MSLFDTVKSWLPADKLDKAADEIYELLLKMRVTHGRNLGVDLPNDDQQLALVVKRALVRHPDMTVVCNQKNFTLALQNDLNGNLSRELREKLKDGGFTGIDNVVVPPQEKK